ncbi:MAG TPA: DUF2127 domain-containing protein [Kofleriaceae bacterium]
MSVEAEVRRPDFGLRVIIVWKAIKGCLLVAFAVAALILRNGDVHTAATHFVEWLGLDPAGPRIDQLLDRLETLTPHRITTIGIGAFVVAAIMFLEAWGLHRRRVWAEWLTVIVTSSFIPLELYHLVENPSLGKVATLIANIAIVVYLLRHRWLFIPGRIGRWWKQRRLATAAHDQPEREQHEPR